MSRAILIVDDDVDSLLLPRSFMEWLRFVPERSNYIKDPNVHQEYFYELQKGYERVMLTKGFEPYKFLKNIVYDNRRKE